MIFSHAIIITRFENTVPVVSPWSRKFGVSCLCLPARRSWITAISEITFLKKLKRQTYHKKKVRKTYLEFNNKNSKNISF